MGFRGHESKLFKRRFRLVVRKFVFSNRVINSWNSLPVHYVNYNTVDAFYRAMLCIRGTSHGPVSVRLSVCLSVCPSQVGVLLKRLNVGSHKQHPR